MTLLELFRLLKKHLALVVVIPVVLALATAAVCWGFMGNKYTATVSVYVLSSRDSTSTTTATTYSEFTASQLMANDIAELAASSTVQDRAASELNMSSLDGYNISVTSSTETRVIELSVTGDDAEAAAVVANQVADTLSTVAQGVMEVDSVNVIDAAQVPTSPSGPPRLMYTAVAFLAGIFLAIAIVVIMDMVNTRVRTPEEAAELLDLPVIGRIPAIRD